MMNFALCSLLENQNTQDTDLSSSPIPETLSEGTEDPLPFSDNTDESPSPTSFLPSLPSDAVLLKERTFVINGQLPSLNAVFSSFSNGFPKGLNMKRHSEDFVIEQLRTQVSGYKCLVPVFIKYKWFEADKRRDLDNVSAFGRKVIQDALKKLGVIEDDGWNNVVGFSDCFFLDTEHPRIEISFYTVWNT